MWSSLNRFGAIRQYASTGADSDALCERKFDRSVGSNTVALVEASFRQPAELDLTVQVV